MLPGAHFCFGIAHSAQKAFRRFALLRARLIHFSPFIGSALLSILILTVAICFFMHEREPAAVITFTSSPTDCICRTAPGHLETEPILQGTLKPDEAVEQCLRAFQKSKQSLALATHSLRLLATNTSDASCEREIITQIDALLDCHKSKALFGEASIIETCDGLRARSADFAQSPLSLATQPHNDQLLALFAELGVPLERSVLTTSGTHTLRRLLGTV